MVTSVKYSHLRHPYVGIIQIRLSVEGPTFLSACNTSSHLFNCRLYCTLVLCKMQGINTTLFKEHGISYLLKNLVNLSFKQIYEILKNLMITVFRIPALPVFCLRLQDLYCRRLLLKSYEAYILLPLAY